MSEENPTNTILIDKLHDPQQYQNIISYMMCVRNNNMEEAQKIKNSSQASIRTNTTKANSSNILGKGDNKQEMKKASQACKEYRRKMSQTLSMLNNNMSSMLRESFNGIDNICTRVRNCLYEIEMQTSINGLEQPNAEEGAVMQKLTSKEDDVVLQYVKSVLENSRIENFVGNDQVDITRTSSKTETFVGSTDYELYNTPISSNEILVVGKNEARSFLIDCDPKKRETNENNAKMENSQNGFSSEEFDKKATGAGANIFEDNKKQKERSENLKNFEQLKDFDHINDMPKNNVPNQESTTLKTVLNKEVDKDPLPEQKQLNVILEQSSKPLLSSSFEEMSNTSETSEPTPQTLKKHGPVVDEILENEKVLIDNLKELRTNIIKIKEINNLQKIKTHITYQKTIAEENQNTQEFSPDSNLSEILRNAEDAMAEKENRRMEISKESPPASGYSNKNNIKELDSDHQTVPSVACARREKEKPREEENKEDKTISERSNMHRGIKNEQKTDHMLESRQYVDNSFSADIIEENIIEETNDFEYSIRPKYRNEDPGEEIDFDQVVKCIYEVSKTLSSDSEDYYNTPRIIASLERKNDIARDYNNKINPLGNGLKEGQPNEEVISPHEEEMRKTDYELSKSITVKMNKINDRNVEEDIPNEEIAEEDSSDIFNKQQEETDDLFVQQFFDNLIEFSSSLTEDDVDTIESEISSVEHKGSSKVSQSPREGLRYNKNYLDDEPNMFCRVLEKIEEEIFLEDSACCLLDSPANTKSDEDEEDSFYVSDELEEVKDIVEEVLDEMVRNTDIDSGIFISKEERAEKFETDQIKKKKKGGNFNTSKNKGTNEKKSNKTKNNRINDDKTNTKKIEMKEVKNPNLPKSECIKKDKKITQQNMAEEGKHIKSDDKYTDESSSEDEMEMVKKITIFQDFSIGAYDISKIQSVLQFAMRRLTDKIWVNGNVTNDEDTDVLYDKEVIPPDVYRKRALVNIHEKLLQQIDAGDSLLGFLRLMERKKFYSDNTDDTDELKTVALTLMNPLEKNVSRVKLEELTDNEHKATSTEVAETKAKSRPKEPKRRVTVSKRKRKNKHRRTKTILDDENVSVVALKPQPKFDNQRQLSRAEQLARKYMDSLYFSPRFGKRIRRLPNQTVSKELKFTEKGTKSRDTLRPLTPPKPRGSRSNESCSSHCTCKLLVQNATPSLTSYRSQCRIHWMRAKIRQTGKNRAKSLNFYDILDDLTPRDVAPFRSEYPRKDNDKVEITDVTARKVQDTFLYNLLYEKRDLKSAWSRLLKPKLKSTKKSHLKHKEIETQNIKVNSNIKFQDKCFKEHTSVISKQHTHILEDHKDIWESYKENMPLGDGEINQNQSFQREDEEWVIEKLLPYMTDPQPHFYRSVTILPVKVFYDNFPSLNNAINLQDLYSQDIDQEFSQEIINDARKSASPRREKAIKMDYMSPEDILDTPQEPRVFIKEIGSKRSSPRKHIERSKTSESIKRAENASPKSSPRNKTPAQAKRPINTQEARPKSPNKPKMLTEKERALWANKYGKSTGQKLVNYVSSQPEKIPQKPHGGVFGKSADGSARTVVNKRVKETLRVNSADKKNKNVENSNVVTAAGQQKKLASNAVTSYQARRQRMMLSQLQSLKARNTMIQDNIQKAIEVIESKMVDILSAPNDSGSVDAFNVMENEITQVLKMMKTSNPPGKEEHKDQPTPGRIPDQLIPEKDNTSSLDQATIEVPETIEASRKLAKVTSLPTSNQTEELQIIQKANEDSVSKRITVHAGDSPSSQRLFRKLHEILASEGSMPDSDSKQEDDEKVPVSPKSKKRLKSKTTTQLTENRRRRKLMMNGTGTEVAITGIYEDTSTSGEEKFVITVAREPPRKRTVRPKSKEKQSDPDNVGSKSPLKIVEIPEETERSTTAPSSEEVKKQKERTENIAPVIEDILRKTEEIVENTEKTAEKVKDPLEEKVEASLKETEMISLADSMAIKKEMIKNEIVSSIKENLEKIKEGIDSEDLVKGAVAKDSSNESCGDGMATFEKEVDQVIAKVDDICSRLANDDGVVSSSTDLPPSPPPRRTVTQPATSEVTGVKSDEFLTPFMSALKQLRGRSSERLGGSAASSRANSSHRPKKEATDVTEKEPGAKELEYSPSYYHIINFLDTLSAIEEVERPIEVHIARPGSVVVEEQIAEVVYPVNIIHQVRIDTVKSVDEKGDCKLPPDRGDSTGSGDHSEASEPAVHVPVPPKQHSIEPQRKEITNLNLPLKLPDMKEVLLTPSKSDTQSRRGNDVKGSYGAHALSRVSITRNSDLEVKSRSKLVKKCNYFDSESTEDVFQPIKDVMRFFADDISKSSAMSIEEQYLEMSRPSKTKPKPKVFVDDFKSNEQLNEDIEKKRKYLISGDLDLSKYISLPRELDQLDAKRWKKTSDNLEETKTTKLWKRDARTERKPSHFAPENADGSSDVQDVCLWKKYIKKRDEYKDIKKEPQPLPADNSERVLSGSEQFSKTKGTIEDIKLKVAEEFSIMGESNCKKGNRMKNNVTVCPFCSTEIQRDHLETAEEDGEYLCPLCQVRGPDILGTTQKEDHASGILQNPHLGDNDFRDKKTSKKDKVVSTDVARVANNKNNKRKQEAVHFEIKRRRKRINLPKGDGLDQDPAKIVLLDELIGGKTLEKIYVNQKCEVEEYDLGQVDEIIDGLVDKIRKSTKSNYVTRAHHEKLLKSFYTAIFTVMFVALVFDYSC